MNTPSNAAFLSYRRDAAAIYVLAVYQHLEAHHIDAFYDIESIKAGQFGEIILGQIAARPYFLPVLTPGTLARCVDSGDWVRREIEHALSLNRVLVPLYTPDFEFADLDKYLPHLAARIKGFNMVELPIKQLKYFKYAMQDVVENYLKPISITLATVTPAAADQVARAKRELSAASTVSEKQLSAQEYFNRGNERDDKGDYDGAIADFTDAIRLKPDYAAAYYNRGIARRNKGDNDGAIADYTDAIRLKSDYAAAYNNRGVARGNKGDHDGAIADFTDAIRLKPDYADAYYNRGIARLNKGDHDGAIADYTDGIRLKPDHANAYLNRAIARDKKGDKQGAAADYQRCLEINPNDPQADIMRKYIAAHGKR